MIYRAMLERLDYDPDHPRRARDELDRALDVGEWRMPGVPARREQTERSRTPSWWHGDEEASQSFLRAVGVVT